MANENYPPGTFKLPGDRDVEKEYIFEFNGEIVVSAYSEEGAEIKLKNDIKYLLYEAWVDGKITLLE